MTLQEFIAALKGATDEQRKEILYALDQSAAVKDRADKFAELEQMHKVAAHAVQTALGLAANNPAAPIPDLAAVYTEALK